LFAFTATGESALIVVASTVFYAGAAIALAARVFGSESVLYSEQTGWADLFRRPRERQPAPTLTAALVCLALMVPAYFTLLSLLANESSVRTQLLFGVMATALVFGGMPLLASWYRRTGLEGSLAIPRHAALIALGTLLVAFSLWTIDHGVVVLGKTLRGVTLDPDGLKKIAAYTSELRALPLLALVVAIGLVPAIFEEAFFRGYLYAAVRTVSHASTTIVVTAVVFGVFHVFATNTIAFERLLSSTLTGIVLGWVRWRTGSILPGMLLHFCHNTFLAFIIYYEPALVARGIGVSEGQHLPPALYAGGAVAVGLGLILIWAVTRSRMNEEPA
jgi:ABC-2 type transport system permease protein/sodium transport system permease protein